MVWYYLKGELKAEWKKLRGENRSKLDIVITCIIISNIFSFICLYVSSINNFNSFKI